MVQFFNALQNNKYIKFLKVLDKMRKEHFFKLTSYNCTEASKVIINKAIRFYS